MKTKFTSMPAVPILLFTLFTSNLPGQQVIPPPPRPTDDGPSLADVMKNIQDLLSRSFVHNFTLQYVRDGKPQSTQYMVEFTQLLLDPQTCNMRYHVKVFSGVAVAVDTDVEISLNRTISIHVKANDQELQLAYGTLAFPDLPSEVLDGGDHFHTSPKVFDIRLVDERYIGRHLLINSVDSAKRLAVELNRAVGLCTADKTSLPIRSDANPPLTDTMQFIQDKLNNQGPIRYQETAIRNKTQEMGYVDQKTDQITDVRANPGSCQISFHTNSSSEFENANEHIARNEDKYFIINLRLVTQISVWSSDETDATSTNKSQNYRTYRTTPSVFHIRLKTSDEWRPILTIGDEDIATRLGRALNHAAEVCTPYKKPDPF
ncbi:MAG TPA: hypothetical protein VKP58_12470 [Candidatus Acidoferrum sp.]|nr:hypothetical protein [Candidatus Acidoferrum sp.]